MKTKIQIGSIVLHLLIYISSSPLTARETAVNSSNNYTVSGFISDAETGEVLIGTNIYAEETQKGCTSNIYGFYSLTLPAGRYTLVYNYLGYEFPTNHSSR